MTTIDLSGYGPIISDELVAKEIYELILNSAENEEVTIDMRGVRLMATFCAKQIFGGLYITLGGERFYQNVHVMNATENIKKTIGIGIEMSLSQTK